MEPGQREVHLDHDLAIPLDLDAEDVEIFSDDDLESSEDTTAQQVMEGKDLQGIPWRRLRMSREGYRATRLHNYKNYVNVEVPLEKLRSTCKEVEKGHRLFDFYHNTRKVQSSIVHFQLRNLMSSTTKHDVYVNHRNRIQHFSDVTRKNTTVLDVSGMSREPGARWGHVQVCTMNMGRGLLVVGGFHGDMVVKSTENGCTSYCHVTHNDNGITNAVDITTSPSGAEQIVTSNNDAAVRVFDAATLKCAQKADFSWAVNYTACNPADPSLMCVVGDDPEIALVDKASGKRVSTLQGHYDFSFAAAWHPNGKVLATGNQDTTTRLWDIRYPGAALATLGGRMGAIRSLRFSGDGRFLAMAEPADFVHIFDTHADYSHSQEIDIFGEIAGCSFSPDSEAFFICVSDMTYSSLLQFHRPRSPAPVFF
uniref:Uncharacterized protein n=1 Tax=Tetraselmis sp. GSL018 TaxID=582737 RepID=A0A061S6I8_9CHLO|mmetsp:Transcript_32361/g.76831  ORF Transcript_32361/g.76831 Transcript_32361/m.76831 type:complete len:423 (+) Transcript_32361:86-1354(+)|eukprot:CAMPEP_0177597302 /NCGR_PEP_ID=MMETSP0419_2-20121207/11629_1 /TAXON_ID=582737 /ORGANISM="Tetraselmis sp., Strain GSL018" /LENGTH=422 /DNA_ID=CAMNT_0019089443 /DNA_START=567 /DNA_END=1835 /DNA_ORIENTATION=-